MKKRKKESTRPARTEWDVEDRLKEGFGKNKVTGKRKANSEENSGSDDITSYY